MSVPHLATALIVIFVVFAVVLTGRLFYAHWRRRSFRRHTSHPPSIRSSNQSPDFPADEAATKEMLYFFCLKPNISPEKNTDLSSPEDHQVVDVFKLLEANGPAKFLCTIKEEDKEDVESKADVDFVNKPVATKDVCLPSLAEEPVAEKEEEEVAVTVDGGDGDMKTEYSTPCDSPLFFSPAGSPSRDFMETKFSVNGDVTGNIDDR